MPTIEQAIKRLHHSDGQHVAVAIWCEDDVFVRARERGLTITREQAQEVLRLMDSKHDCEMGISWATMDVYLDEIAKDVQETKRCPACNHPVAICTCQRIHD